MTDRIPAALDMPRLQRLLGSPDVAWLVDRVADRIASGTEPAHGTVTLADPVPAQRRAPEPGCKIGTAWVAHRRTVSY